MVNESEEDKELDKWERLIRRRREELGVGAPPSVGVPSGIPSGFVLKACPGTPKITLRFDTDARKFVL